MTIVELLQTLRSSGVSVSTEHGKLKTVAPKGAIDAGLATLIRNRKDELVAFLERAGEQADAAALRVLKAPAAATYPLSFAQQRLWFIDQLQGHSRQYNMPTALRLSGRLDVAALQRALDALVERHEALRTCFAAVDGTPVQVVQPAAGVAIARHDLSGLDAAAQQSRLQEMASAEAARPFDLSRDLMLRCSLINLGEDEHALLFTLHHIASDGWSLGVLVREIGALYTAFCQGQANPLAPLDVQYTDYASWQRGLLQGDVLQRQLGFWREHLDGAPGLLELPTDRARPPVQSYAGNYVPVRLSADISNGLRRLSQRHGTTLFMTLLAGWSLLLSRLSGQDDVVVGTPVANRQRAEIEPLIGFFANTLAMRVQLQDNPSVAGLLAQVRQTALQAYAYQDLPFEQVVEALQPARSLSHSPVFQVMLAMNNTPGGGDSGLPGLRLAPLRVPHASTHFDLVLSLNEAEEEIRGGLEYASDIFDHATLERWVGHLAVLLQAMAADEQCAVQDLPLLDAAARARVVDEFNATATDYARDSLVHELVEAQVPRSPQAVAVVYDDQSLTYAELNERANRLAHYLRGQGAGPDARVVICMERSLEMAVAVLGTLKAGAAYVPLDPAYPAERRAYMLQDSAPMLVLTQTALLGEFGDSPLPLLALDVETFAAQPASDPPRVQGSDAANLAYVIYTSGSTGRPKGVCLPHRALVNLMQWHLQELAPTARCLQFASLSFDASFHELFAAWLCGGAVIVPPEEVRRDSVALAQFLQQQRIDKAILPVVMLQHLAEQHCEAPQPLAALREVMATGEQLKLTPAIRRLFEQLPQARLHNHYGPSETHVVTAEILAGAPADWPTFPSIGRPIANSQIYVLDRQRRPVPIGVFGEVFIGGDNLARSYLNRPELTQERFVSETLGGAAPQRLYKTGDVGRWGNDGHIEYVGRNDHQVKIRGFRVEPGEIETALTAHAQVREAVVVARDDSFGGKRLVAYLTHPDGVTADVEALREYLRGALPEYMVPAQFVSLDALPLSANRKIDRSALPEPEASAALQVAPQTATELCLAQIWQRILKQESIGRHANFFELGGHSLLATRVVSEIAKAFGKPLAVRALFEHPSLAGLAAHIDSQRHTGYAAIAPRPRDGALPLSFAQQRLWILDKVDKAASALYRIPAALRLSGQLDRAALQATLDRIVARHESLRTGFVEIDGMARQQIAPATAGFVLLDHDLRDLDAAAQADAVAQLSASESQADFDLARGPLVRGRLLQLADSEHVLLVTQHHIVSDGWSIGVLVKEVSALYTAFCQGQPDPLPPLAIQYADFAAWQRERLHGALLQGHLDYWRSQLAGLPAVHNLPLDKPRPAQQRFAGGRAQLDLDAATLAGLHALARRHDASLFMLLQAAFALLVARWSGETDIVMGTPIAGRLHPDVEPLIGFFVNTLVLRSDLSANPTFEQLLAQARATALAAYEHQEIPFEMLVDELKPVRSLSHAPLFQLLFSMQNNEQAVLDLPGLSLAPAASRSEQSKFDLQLSALETGHGLRLSWTYAQSLFEPASIARLSAAFGRLLQAVVATPQLPVMQLPLLDATDRARLAQWNETAADFDDACFHHLFEQQARRTPDAIAIRHGDESLSYAQLNRRANQLAQQLRQRGVGPDTTVALCLERSLQLGPAILGVMKAGGAYLPLDAASPDEHLGYILQDSGAVLAISHGTLAQRLARLGASVLALDAADSGSGLDEAPLVPGLSTANLAYSIYTSGSSGRPKGVLVEHRSLANLAANLSAGGIADGLIRGCWALAASTAFDGSIKALVQWASGGEVLVVPESTKLDAQALRALLREYRVDIMDCTPSLLESWLAAGLGDCLPNLVIGGEAINPDLWARLVEWQAASGRQAINVYGPSECCVDTTWARVSGSQPVIGRNLANVVCHVVSESGEIVPVGVPGELYVGGAGVARGYRNQPELTAARFVADPFGGSGRLYRSGDRVRRREDGALEFLGRLDDQVKLRGFRIELGEPEAVLRRCDGVREALVLVRGTGSEARLVAYVVADAQPALVDALKAQLAAQLPVYMHPAAYVVLERLPLTVNGKVDKAALPLPELQAAQAYVAPGGETEARLAAIWQQVLRRERVGIHDNFFEIGGDSILAIQVTSRANQAGIGITTRQLFEAQTIAALAQCVQPQQQVERPQGAVQGALRLLPIQQQFLAGDALDKHHHNQAVLLQVPLQLQPEALRTAVAALYQRHDALRLRFVERDGQWQAQHQALDDAMLAASCVVETLPADAQEIAAFLTARCNHWQAGFDLAQGPLLRVVLFQGETTARLLLLAHHLVIDGVSWRILLADLEQAYRQIERGETVALAPKTSSLQQWGEALAAYAQSPALQQEKAYWLAQYRRPVPLLPADHATPDGGEMAAAAHVGLRLSAEDTRALLKQCNRAYRTQINELLLAGVYLGLRRWSGEPGLRIALEGHGREALFDNLDLTETVGWFTSIYPLTLWQEDASVEAVIKATKEQYRSVPARGIGYGVLRHLAQDAELMAAEAGQWPELAFNYLGQSEQAVNEETFFQGSSESAGASASARRRRAHALVLKGMVAGGELRLSLEYPRERYERATMEQLAAHVEAALREVVEHCATRERAAFTPSDLPLAQVGQAQLDEWQARYPAMTRLYPATPMQAGLLFESLLGVSSYLIQTYPVLRGELDAGAFRRAWEQVVERHDIFRTAFVGEGEGLHQLVSAQATLPWHEEDWSGLAADEQERRFDAYRAQDKATAFDFARPPLMRVALFHLGARRYQLLWTMHHILLDGWCIPLVYRDVMQLLQAQLQGRSASLPAAPPFEAHIAWLQRQDRERAKAHWGEVLGRIDAPTPLAVDRLPAGGESGYREQFLELSQAQTEALQAAAQAQRMTVNTLVQWAWAYLLHRYSGEAEVVFGATIAGRPAEVPGIEDMVGLFINTIPVRVAFAPEQGIAAALATLQQGFQRSSDYGYLSLPEIQRQSRVRAGTPLFDSLLAFANYPLDAMTDAAAAPAASRLEIERAGHDDQTNFKLSLNANLDRILRARLAYRAEDFAQDTIERLLGHLGRILDQLPAAIAAGDGIASLLGEDEIRQLRAWGEPLREAAPDVCVHELFEAQAARTPHAVAAVFGEQQLSYGQLNAQANQVAHYLLQQGVQSDTLVGLCVERSPDMLVGMLGILKAGAAYLPLDPDYPQERIAFMLQDSAVEHVLTQNAILEALPLLGEKTVLPLDPPLRELFLAAQPEHNPGRRELGLTPRHLAYAIYTSGSTGQPKGALIEHRNVVRLVHAANYVQLSPGAVMAQASNSAFDAATFEIWGALANGMSLFHIGKETLLDPLRLARALQDGRVDTLFITTAVFNQMSIVDASGFARLQHLLFGGEGVDMEAVNRVLAAGKPRHLLHVYGPTENTTFSSFFEIVEKRADTYPIGKPIAGTTQYVLDAQRRLVPCGVTGELYLGGDGVGRGYLGQPELSNERFVADPFGSAPDARLYRSGDLVRWLPEGEVQFVGRVDDQIKIRGFRIELGEIESQLRGHEAVQETVVVARQDGGTTRLVAYVVCVPQAEERSEVLLAKDWRAYLKQRLPDYMLPAAFVVLDSLPLNSNGKVDKRRLPAPDYQAQQLYVAPQSEIEQKLADIWCQLLRIDQVGVHDNFFEMGGDSILLIQVVSRANQAGIGITTKHLFEAQTIAEVAKLASSEGAIVAPQQEICGALPLLPIHHLFLGGDACDRHHFNQSVLLQTPADFDAAALRAMVAAIYRRHDALRLRFVQEQGQWQASHAPLDAALLADSCVVETLPADPAGQRAFLSLRCNHWQAGFDLAQGPLLRAVYFAPAEAGDSGRLLLTVHHIVVDGVSWRVLLADLEQAYEQHRNGQAVVLRAKTSSFQQWGSALLDYAHSATLQQEKAYWLAQSGAQVAPLPVDREIEGQGAIATSRAVVVSLDADETRALLQQCPRAYRTQVNELLLAGVYLGMREWTGADGLRLRLEGHGRETLFDQLDITQTVGWFTSVYPLTLRSAGSDVGEVIKAVKEQYRAVPHHGIGYGVLRYLANDAELGAMAAAVDESGLEFNYLGQFDQVINADTRFQAAAEGSGAQASSRRQRSARLALSGKVFGGQMQFALSYSNSQYDESTMRRLAQLLQDGMRRVIAHCQQPGVGAYTPSDFPLARVGQPQLDAWQLRYPSLARLYPATPMQAGLLFESLLDRSAYVVQTFPILRGALDVAAFRSAWQQAVDRHDVFRTAFVEGEELHQLVLAQASLPWHEEDWSGLPAQEQQHRFEVYRAQDKQAGFDFARPPMIRLALFRLGNDRYQLLWTLHHVLLDGWCVPLVYRDVMRLYQAQLEGRAADLPPPPPYEQHIAWLQRQDGDAARSHWRNLLAQIDAPTPLVVDRLPGDGDSGRRDESVELTPEQTQALQATAQAQHTTVNTLVQWAWAYLLHRYSGESDVVFGATISGRPAAVPGIEEMIGLFINAIPVKVSFGTQRSVAASIAALHQDFQRSNDFAYLSLPEIQRQSRVRAGTPLFDSLMEFGNYPLDAMADVAATPAASELQLERRGHDEASNYKLGLNVSFGRTLKVKIGYRAEQFAQATLQRLLRHLARVLAQLPAAVAGTGTIGSVLDEAELAQLHDWGSGPQLALPVLCAHQLFEAQVRRDGQATAVVCGEQRLSYAELNAQANRVARYLLDQGVRPDSLVGLCVERSPDMLVGLLGILKAGAAYLPLDPEYPEDRIAYMLQDSAVEHVLTHSAVLEALPLLGDKTVLPLDGPMRDLLLGAYADGDIDPAESAVTPAHLAYAIYTSGSTGTPKGVLLEHRGLVNLAQNQSRLHALSPRSRVLAFASLSFDAATWEWLMALSNGASLHICAQDERYSAPRLSALLLEQGITHATLPPALLAQLDASADYALQVLVVAGEACDEQLAWTWAQRCRVCNAYGPTETTVCATQSDVLPGQRISLGRALANFDVQVLDAQLQPQPAGLPGELCIGGAGLARGYLNQPQLTAERFVAHPQRPGERLYRSGDLVRWLPDGELQFLGRVDSQVKIRGFRVELGEIEARLAACDGVRQAVVVAREDVAGSKRLVAYLVVAAQRDTLPNEVLLAKQWAQQLRQQLPDYMVPAAFVIVEQIPLTGNGKVDQRRLPAPDYQGQQDYVAPQSATETTLLAAWSDLLKLDSLGVTHDFFDLGGDSILIMRMSMEIKAAFAVELPVREIFERPTIRSLAARIDELVLQQSLKTSISFDVDAAESNNQELIEL